MMNLNYNIYSVRDLESILDKHKDITHIDIDLEETGIIYNFNENFELKIIEIEGATIY